MKENKRRLIIKFSYSEDPYLYERSGAGPQHFVARLNDLNAVSGKLGITRKEAFDLILDLVRKRGERTTKLDMKEKMELILFDPFLYFGIDEKDINGNKQLQ